MRVWRNHYRTEGGVSFGYGWFATRRDAVAAASLADEGLDNPEDRTEGPEAFDIEVSKDGILRSLNRFASHPDNG